MIDNQELKKKGDDLQITPKPSTVNLECRYYEKKYPDPDDLVVVQVKDVVENGAYVTLLEYGGTEGMITPNEFTTVRMKSVHKAMKVGKQEVVMVLRVDKEKGYIDLSKKRVQVEEMKACEEKFNKAKQVHSILRNVAEKAGLDLEKLYEDIGWPLYKIYGHAFDAFKISLL